MRISADHRPAASRGVARRLGVCCRGVVRDGDGARARRRVPAPRPSSSRRWRARSAWPRRASRGASPARASTADPVSPWPAELRRFRRAAVLVSPRSPAWPRPSWSRAASTLRCAQGPSTTPGDVAQAERAPSAAPPPSVVATASAVTSAAAPSAFPPRRPRRPPRRPCRAPRRGLAPPPPPRPPASMVKPASTGVPTTSFSPPPRIHGT